MNQWGWVAYKIYCSEYPPPRSVAMHQIPEISNANFVHIQV